MEKNWRKVAFTFFFSQVETLASVIEQILETLAGLSYWELEVFKEVLRKIHYKR